MSRGRRGDPVEGRADGGLAVARDVEAGRVIGAVGAIHVTNVSGTKRDAQQAAEGRGGEQGLILEPRLVPAVLKPTIQPEIVTGGKHSRTVERPRQDVVRKLGEARCHVIPIGRLVDPPELDQRMAVADAHAGVPQLPVSAHRHDGGRRSLMPRHIFAEANRTPPQHGIAQGAGNEELAPELHANVPGPNPGPRQQVLYLTLIEPRPFHQGRHGGWVQLEEPPELAAHVARERGRVGPPCRGKAREVGEYSLPGTGRWIGDGQDGRMAQMGCGPKERACV